MSIQKVYKAVLTHKDSNGKEKYISVCGINPRKSWCVTYTPGIKAYPKIPGTPLLAFSDYGSAVRAFYQHIVLECEAEVYPRDHPLYRNCFLLPNLYLMAFRPRLKVITRAKIESIWNMVLEKMVDIDEIRAPFYEYAPVVNIPTNTVFCEWVKPIGVALYDQYLYSL